MSQEKKPLNEDEKERKRKKFIERAKITLPNIFKNKDLLIKTLNFTRKYSDWKWYNIATIVLSYRDFDIVCVQSKKSWMDYDQNIHIDINAKSALYLNEFGEIEHYYDYNAIESSSYKVVKSKIHIAVKKIQKKYYDEIFYTKNIRNFVIEVCKRNPFYLNNAEYQDLLILCIKYVVKDLFDVKEVDLSLITSTSFSTEQALPFFIGIIEIIDDIPNYISLLVAQMKEKEQSDEAMDEAIKVDSMNIKERIAYAKDKLYNKVKKSDEDDDKKLNKVR